ncbi:carbohydrate porin [Limobrevibacterium gyesilva]|uniref:Carbohydrate porin n=1 Tax=Limobrevibacterium gyesilva TaxID=2991712 RepID=A0AA42CFK8_9PROT|nr:carbohydrate porin [Limobrevibacterium gyesilva]MCW3477273.1 carbohydrate porin [Limobrevibacterium gyesilva]
MFVSPILRRAALVAGLSLLAGAAAAQPADDANDAPAPAGVWAREQLLGDPGGLRSRLEAAGVTLGVQDTNEVWSNLRGGLRTGTVYLGQTQMTLKVDTGRAGLWQGGTFYASAYQIRGTGPSAQLVGNLQTVSGIEATRSIRLYDLWYEQALADGRLSVRIGQMGADEEFIVSTYGAVFLNSSFGFPALAAVDLPSGGPAYPLATPGVRVKFRPTDALTVLAAVFNGNPAGAGAGDPQARDASGTALRVGDGALAFFEAQYALNQGEGAEGLPGTYRVGAWYNSLSFPSQRSASNGVSLASPGSNGIPRGLHGNYSLYAVADQMVWRKPGTKDEGIGLFARVMGAPGDRNLSDFYVNGGATWKGAIPGRADDTIGLGVAYLRIGGAARGLDQDTALFSGAPFPVRSNETVIEATYQMQLAGWWQLQPDVQYVMRPGGKVPNPNNPAQVLKNAVVIGLRSVVTF